MKKRTILNIAKTVYDIEAKCLDNPSLKNCSDKDTMDKANPISDQIDMLEKLAKTSTMSEEEFMKKIRSSFSTPN